MAPSQLPPRASLEYLKKLAKERLHYLRRRDPRARLADAQLAIAREYGFPSWRALKAEIDRRRAPELTAYFDACAAGDLVVLHALLDEQPGLVRERNTNGATSLHLAVRHPDALRLLLARGADPNARDTGDNALPLHFAAGGGPIESVRALLDAGSDVQGVGDAHKLDTIGWATCFADARRDIVALLVQRGARHHIFSGVALNDVDLVRRVVSDDRKALTRRLASTEQEQTALHYVVAPPDGLVGGTFRTGPHYRTLELLIELGADCEATDAKGRTPLAVAMLRGDAKAMRILHASGARPPEQRVPPPSESPAALARSIRKLQPMFVVPDITATLAWYHEIGYELAGSHEEDGKIDWAMVRFGNAEIMFVPGDSQSTPARTGVSLWIETDRIDDLYAALKAQQLERAGALLRGEAAGIPELRFTADLYTAFYGQREFGIIDPSGVELMFFQPLHAVK